MKRHDLSGDSYASPTSPPSGGTIDTIFGRSSPVDMVSRLRQDLASRIQGNIARTEEIKDATRHREWNSHAVIAVFESVRKQSDGKISLDDFAEAYIAQYRQIQLKYSEIERKHKEVEVELTAATVSLQQARSTERMNPETGISQNEHGGSLGRLEVTLVDARNLASMDYSGTSDPFVQLSIESENPLDNNKVMCGEPCLQKSHIKWKDLNPRWDEAFCFKPIYSKNAVLAIRVFDEDKILAAQLMGMATIHFKELQDQLKHDVWKQLHNDPGSVTSASATSATRAKGSIHIKAQFLYSQVEYFEGCVQKQKEAREILSAEKMETQIALAQMQAPFGENTKRTASRFGDDYTTKAAGRRRRGSSAYEWLTGGRYSDGDGEGSFLIPGRRIPQHQCFWCCTRLFFCLAIVAAIAVVFSFTFSFGRGNDKGEFDMMPDKKGHFLR